MKKRYLVFPMLLAMLLLTACNTSAEKKMLYDEAPSRYEYGVFVNMDLNAGDVLTDYEVAFNNFADRTAYVFYSEKGQTPVTEQMAGLTAEDLAALAAEGESRIMRIGHIDRGYENLERDLSTLGADIVRVETEQIEG